MYKRKYNSLLSEKNKKLEEIIKSVKHAHDSRKGENPIRKSFEIVRNIGSVDSKHADYFYRSIDTSICRISKIIHIEFLTINVYTTLKQIMNDVYKSQIKIYMLENDLNFNTESSANLMENSKVFDSLVKTKILQDDQLRSTVYHYIRYLINKDFKLLDRAIRFDYEDQFERLALKTLTTVNRTVHIDVPSEMADEKGFNSNFFISFLNGIVLTKIFCPVLVYARNLQTKDYGSLLGLAQIDGTFVNRVVKSFSGFLFSFFYISLLYYYLRYQHLADVFVGVPILCLVGLVLMFGLSFYSQFRAIALLILPFFASFQGRMMIACFCLLLCSSNIVPNAYKNVGILEETLVCSKEMLNSQVEHLNDLDGILGYIVKVVLEIKQYCLTVQKALLALKYFLVEILEFLKESIKIIKYIFDMCNDAFGKPLDACIQGWDVVVSSCWSRIPNESENPMYIFTPVYAGICSVFIGLKHMSCPFIAAIQIFCKSFKLLFQFIYNYFQIIIMEYWGNFIMSKIEKLSNDFSFSYNASRLYNYTSSTNLNTKKVLWKLKTEINEQIDYASTIVESINYFFPISIILMVLRAWAYHRKYVKSIRYDNYVIGVRFEEIDYLRAKRTHKTVLPLKTRMKYDYIELFDVWQTNREFRSTKRAILMFFITLLPITFAVCFDQMMIVVNQLVAKHAGIRISLKPNFDMKLNIEGDGFLASVYRFLFEKFSDLESSDYMVNTFPCLPNTSIVEPHIYDMLLTYTILLLSLSLFQSYIKRFRSVIVGCVYPERDQERAVWLYNHILLHKTRVDRWDLTNRCLINTENFSKNNPFRYLIGFLNEISSTLLKYVYWVLNVAFVGTCWIFCCNYCCGIIDRTGLSKFFYKNERRLAYIYNRIKSVFSKNDYCVICSTGLTGGNSIKCMSHFCDALYCQNCFQEQMNQECPQCHFDIELESRASSVEVDSSEDEKDFQMDIIQTDINRSDHKNLNLTYDYQKAKRHNSDLQNSETFKKDFKITKNCNELNLVNNTELYGTFKNNQSTSYNVDNVVKIQRKRRLKVVCKEIENVLINKLKSVIDTNDLIGYTKHERFKELFKKDNQLYDVIYDETLINIVNNIETSEYFNCNDLDSQAFYDALFVSDTDEFWYRLDLDDPIRNYDSDSYEYENDKPSQGNKSWDKFDL